MDTRDAPDFGGYTKYELHVFFNNTPHRKFSLNCKRCFKSRKELKRKNCYIFIKKCMYFVLNFYQIPTQQIDNWYW